MDDFTRLKRTYPISQYKRECDGYEYIMENSTEEERLNWGIIDSELKSIIDVDEKYIYEVGKIDNKFITKSTSPESIPRSESRYRRLASIIPPP